MTAQSEITALPHALMSEKYLLSCMFREPDRFVARSTSDGIDKQSFHIPSHQEMFSAMKADYRKHGSLDVTVFVQEKNIDGSLARMGGPSGITEIFTYAADGGGQWTRHVEILREMKARRLALNASGKLSEASDSTEAIHEAKIALEALQAAVAGPKRASTGKQAVDEFSDRLKSDHAAGEYPGAASGIHQLDEISGGMKPGELWVIAGRPSRGKTVFELQVASAFIDRGEPVAIFSLEAMSHEIVGRLVSCMGRVDFGGITQPKRLSKGDLLRIQRTAATIAAAPLWIDDSAKQTIATIQAECERIRDSHGGLALVVVDYVQIIDGERSRNETREQEVSRASSGLKQLAKALKCPVLSGSQLNENGQTRESRAIEQDADAVLFIVEEGIKIGKMRNGVRDSILPLQLDGKHQRFTERHP